MQSRTKEARKREGRSSRVPKVDVLKVDKDCKVRREWERDYVRLILTVATWFNIEVTAINACASLNSGTHYYIDIFPPVDAYFANRLHYLLGDDSQRVAFNQARIESGLPEWSKLFERPDVRLRTIYRAPGFLAKNKTQKRRW
jgi:hypothetical protein